MVRRILAAFVLVATFLGVAGTGLAQPPDNGAQVDPTPSRLSYVEGSVSFWRPGGSDWAPAQVNTPLAAGDELYTGHDGNLEVQVGGRAFLRAWGDTQVGVANQDANFVQLRMTAGHLALDLRSVDPGDVIEIDTPSAAFTVNQPGFYRVDVTTDRTAFTTRRSGQATITTAAGPAGVVQPGEAVTLDNGPTPTVQRVAAPEPDVWDRWNDARTAALVPTASARYVPPQLYGVNELDHYGTWHVDVTYGPVWVPASVAPEWVPYSTGRWIWDPWFGWTWIDTAPWGWAPYHYGRWVHLGGGWAWAPGPVVVRPVYAPALVVFFGAPGVAVGVAGPSVGWVALSWGEPLVPWWGRSGFVGRPYWAGWGGPRVTNVNVYRNVTVVNAVVVVRSDHFGRRAVQEARIARPDIQRLRPVRGKLAVKPEAASFTPGTGHAQRPPEAQVTRTVVSTRPPVRRPEPPHAVDDKRDDKRSGRSDAKREQPQPGARSDGRPDVKREAKPAPRPDVRGEGARDARPATPQDTRPERKAPGVEAPAARTVPPVPTAPPAVPRRTPAAPATPERPRPPEPPRVEPRSEIRRPDVPSTEPRRPEPQRREPSQPQRREPSRPEPQQPQSDPRRLDTPRSEAPRVDPRARAANGVTPRRVERRVDVAPTTTPRAEPPRRAAGRSQEPVHAVAPRQRPETPARPGAPAPHGRPRQER